MYCGRQCLPRPRLRTCQHEEVSCRQAIWQGRNRGGEGTGGHRKFPSKACPSKTRSMTRYIADQVSQLQRTSGAGGLAEAVTAGEKPWVFSVREIICGEWLEKRRLACRTDIRCRGKKPCYGRPGEGCILKSSPYRRSTRESQSQSIVGPRLFRPSLAQFGSIADPRLISQFLFLCLTENLRGQWQC